MDRRTFLERIAAAASVAAASPLAGGAMRGVRNDNRKWNELLAGYPHSDRTDVSQMTSDELPMGFADPPASAAPWVFWMWIDVDTTPAAMTFDLEQMKAKGIPGFILYNSPAGGLPHTMPRMILVDKDKQFEYEFIKDGEYTDCYTTPIPFPPLQAWTAHWRERIRYVASEAARLELKFCLNMGLSGTTGEIPKNTATRDLFGPRRGLMVELSSTGFWLSQTPILLETPLIGLPMLRAPSGATLAKWVCWRFPTLLDSL